MTSGAATGSISVLLVDDHQMFVQSLARLLADEPDIDIVGVVSTAQDAVRLASLLRPRVALVDYQMPGKDGVEIAREMKANDAEVMIVMLTGAAEDRILLSAIEAGCSGFLTKDRAADEVASAVRAAASGEALISPAMLARLLPRLHRNQQRVGDNLTERERQILGYLAQGWANPAIAGNLHLSVNTIRNYIQAILNKLDAHSKLEAVATGVREGIIDFPARS